MIFAALLLLSLAGGRGYSHYGYVGWAPAGLVVVLWVIFWLTGNLS